MNKKLDIKFLKSQIEKIHKFFLRGDYDQVIQRTKILLKKDKTQVMFYNYIGLSYKQLGRLSEAEKIFLEGLRLFPSSTTFLANLGSIYRNLNKFDKAEECFIRGLEYKPNDTSLLINYANLKRDHNKINAAIDLYEKARSINENIETLLVNLAGAYQIIGNFQKSKEILNILHKKFPNNCTAFKLYSSIHKYSEDDPHQKMMIEKIKNETLSSKDKIKIYFSLSKSYSDQKNIKKEIEYCIKANNENYKTFRNYNFSTEIKRFNKIIEIFQNYEFLKEENLEETDLIFIVGLPRSGTTLTHQIISSHSKVFGAGELPILNNFFSEKIDDSNFIKKIFDDLLNKNQNYLKNIKDTLNNQFKQHNKKQIILDKSPLNFEWIGFIKIIFPNAKVIHLNRNLKDTALSIYKNTFDGDSLPWSYNADDILGFIDLYKKLMSFWNKKMPNYIFNLEYKELVNNPKNEIKKILSFCNLQWEDSCLDFTNSKAGIKTVSILQARQPIYKSSVDLSKQYAELLPFLKKLT